MRADEREKLLREIEIKEEPGPTRSMYFRVGKTADKAITELAAISGVNKSEVIRKLVTRGLTGRDIEIAKESHSVKLDWLVRESKRKRIDAVGMQKSIDEIRERIDWIESSELETSKTVEKLLVEIYCLVLTLFFAENQSLSKLVALTGTTFNEKTRSGDIADLVMAKFLSAAVNDLDYLGRFHGLKIGRASGDKSFAAARAKLIKEAAEERTKQANGTNL